MTEVGGGGAPIDPDKKEIIDEGLAAIGADLEAGRQEIIIPPDPNEIKANDQAKLAEVQSELAAIISQPVESPPPVAPEQRIGGEGASAAPLGDTEGFGEAAALGVGGRVEEADATELQLDSRRANLERSKVLLKDGPERDAYIKELREAGLIEGDQIDTRNIVILPDGRAVPVSADGHPGIIARHYGGEVHEAADKIPRLLAEGGVYISARVKKGKDRATVVTHSIKNESTGIGVELAGGQVPEKGEKIEVAADIEGSVELSTSRLKTEMSARGIATIETPAKGVTQSGLGASNPDSPVLQAEQSPSENADSPQESVDLESTDTDSGDAPQEGETGMPDWMQELSAEELAKLKASADTPPAVFGEAEQLRHAAERLKAQGKDATVSETPLGTTLSSGDRSVTYTSESARERIAREQAERDRIILERASLEEKVDKTATALGLTPDEARSRAATTAEVVQKLINEGEQGKTLEQQVEELRIEHDMDHASAIKIIAARQRAGNSEKAVADIVDRELKTYASTKEKVKNANEPVVDFFRDDPGIATDASGESVSSTDPDRLVIRQGEEDGDEPEIQTSASIKGPVELRHYATDGGGGGGSRRGSSDEGDSAESSYRTRREPDWRKAQREAYSDLTKEQIDALKQRYPRQAEVADLVLRDNLSVTEAAQRLNLQPTDVRISLNRALGNLGISGLHARGREMSTETPVATGGEDGNENGGSRDESNETSDEVIRRNLELNKVTMDPTHPGHSSRIEDLKERGLIGDIVDLTTGIVTEEGEFIPCSYGKKDANMDLLPGSVELLHDDLIRKLLDIPDKESDEQDTEDKEEKLPVDLALRRGMVYYAGSGPDLNPPSISYNKDTIKEPAIIKQLLDYAAKQVEDAKASGGIVDSVTVDVGDGSDAKSIPVAKIEQDGVDLQSLDSFESAPTLDDEDDLDDETFARPGGPAGFQFHPGVGRTPALDSGGGSGGGGEPPERQVTFGGEEEGSNHRSRREQKNAERREQVKRVLEGLTTEQSSKILPPAESQILREAQKRMEKGQPVDVEEIARGLGLSPASARELFNRAIRRVEADTSSETPSEGNRFTSRNQRLSKLAADILEGKLSGLSSTERDLIITAGTILEEYQERGTRASNLSTELAEMMPEYSDSNSAGAALTRALRKAEELSKRSTHEGKESSGETDDSPDITAARLGGPVFIHAPDGGIPRGGGGDNAETGQKEGSRRDMQGRSEDGEGSPDTEAELLFRQQIEAQRRFQSEKCFGSELLSLVEDRDLDTPYVESLVRNSKTSLKDLLKDEGKVETVSKFLGQSLDPTQREGRSYEEIIDELSTEDYIKLLQVHEDKVDARINMVESMMPRMLERYQKAVEILRESGVSISTQDIPVRIEVVDELLFQYTDNRHAGYAPGSATVYIPARPNEPVHFPHLERVLFHELNHHHSSKKIVTKELSDGRKIVVVDKSGYRKLGGDEGGTTRDEAAVELLALLQEAILQDPTISLDNIEDIVRNSDSPLRESILNELKDQSAVELLQGEFNSAEDDSRVEFHGQVSSSGGSGGSRPPERPVATGGSGSEDDPAADSGGRSGSSGGSRPSIPPELAEELARRHEENRTRDFGPGVERDIAPPTADQIQTLNLLEDKVDVVPTEVIGVISAITEGHTRGLGTLNQDGTVNISQTLESLSLDGIDMDESELKDVLKDLKIGFKDGDNDLLDGSTPVESPPNPDGSGGGVVGGDGASAGMSGASGGSPIGSESEIGEQLRATGGQRVEVSPEQQFEYETIEVPISSIVHTHESPQQDKVDEMASWDEEDLRTSYPPLVQPDGKGGYRVMDGTHLLLAQQKRGFDTVTVQVQRPKVQEGRPNNQNGVQAETTDLPESSSTVLIDQTSARSGRQAQAEIHPEVEPSSDISTLLKDVKGQLVERGADSCYDFAVSLQGILSEAGIDAQILIRQNAQGIDTHGSVILPDGTIIDLDPAGNINDLIAQGDFDIARRLGSNPDFLIAKPGTPEHDALTKGKTLAIDSDDSRAWREHHLDSYSQGSVQVDPQMLREGLADKTGIDSDELDPHAEQQKETMTREEAIKTLSQASGIEQAISQLGKDYVSTIRELAGITDPQELATKLSQLEGDFIYAGGTLERDVKQAGDLDSQIEKVKDALKALGIEVQFSDDNRFEGTVEVTADGGRILKYKSGVSLLHEGGHIALEQMLADAGIPIPTRGSLGEAIEERFVRLGTISTIQQHGDNVQFWPETDQQKPIDQLKRDELIENRGFVTDQLDSSLPLGVELPQPRIEDSQKDSVTRTTTPEPARPVRPEVIRAQELLAQGMDPKAVAKVLEREGVASGESGVYVRRAEKANAEQKAKGEEGKQEVSEKAKPDEPTVPIGEQVPVPENNENEEYMYVSPNGTITVTKYDQTPGAILVGPNGEKIQIDPTAPGGIINFMSVGPNGMTFSKPESREAIKETLAKGAADFRDFLEQLKPGGKLEGLENIWGWYTNPEMGQFAMKRLGMLPISETEGETFDDLKGRFTGPVGTTKDAILNAPPPFASYDESGRSSRKSKKDVDTDKESSASPSSQPEAQPSSENLINSALDRARERMGIFLNLDRYGAVADALRNDPSLVEGMTPDQIERAILNSTTKSDVTIEDAIGQVRESDARRAEERAKRDSEKDNEDQSTFADGIPTEPKPTQDPDKGGAGEVEPTISVEEETGSQSEPIVDRVPQNQDLLENLLQQSHDLPPAQEKSEEVEVQPSQSQPLQSEQVIPEYLKDDMQTFDQLIAGYEGLLGDHERADALRRIKADWLAGTSRDFYFTLNGEQEIFDTLLKNKQYNELPAWKKAVLYAKAGGQAITRAGLEAVGDLIKAPGSMVGGIGRTMEARQAEDEAHRQFLNGLPTGYGGATNIWATPGDIGYVESSRSTGIRSGPVRRRGKPIVGQAPVDTDKTPIDQRQAIKMLYAANGKIEGGYVKDLVKKLKNNEISPDQIPGLIAQRKEEIRLENEERKAARKQEKMDRITERYQSDEQVRLSKELSREFSELPTSTRQAIVDKVRMGMDPELARRELREELSQWQQYEERRTTADTIRTQWSQLGISPRDAKRIADEISFGRGADGERISLDDAYRQVAESQQRTNFAVAAGQLHQAVSQLEQRYSYDPVYQKVRDKLFKADWRHPEEAERLLQEAREELREFAVGQEIAEQGQAYRHRLNQQGETSHRPKDTSRTDGPPEGWIDYVVDPGRSRRRKKDTSGPEYPEAPEVDLYGQSEQVEEPKPPIVIPQIKIGRPFYGSVSTGGSTSQSTVSEARGSDTQQVGGVSQEQVDAAYRNASESVRQQIDALRSARQRAQERYQQRSGGGGVDYSVPSPQQIREGESFSEWVGGGPDAVIQGGSQAVDTLRSFTQGRSDSSQSTSQGETPTTTDTVVPEPSAGTSSTPSLPDNGPYTPPVGQPQGVGVPRK